MRALLVAVEDYSTDNRGDVGSWVREAAMLALPQTLTLLRRLDPEGLKVSEEEQAHLTQQLIRALLKQAVERIARLRETALDQLRSIVNQPHDVLPSIPGWEQLQAATALQHTQPSALSDADQGLLGVVGLVGVAEYREAVVEGVVASIGGLDASLCKEASAALLHTLNAPPPPGEIKRSHLLNSVTVALTGLWGRHARHPRLATPILRTAELLLSHTELVCSHDIQLGLLGSVLELTRGECQQCKDVPRLCAAVLVLCQLIVCETPVGSGALQVLLSLTVNRYPKVRKQAAEQLYVQLMTIEDMGLYDADCLDAAYDVLTEIAWDGPLEHVKAARSRLLQIFKLETPDCSTDAAELQQSRQVGSKRADENASYQALINDGSRL